jgi:hypothetical protein
MLKPSMRRDSRLANVRNVASMWGMSSVITMVSIGTAPFLELHHMLDTNPLANTISIGGIFPSRIARSKNADMGLIPESPPPVPCNQYNTGKRRSGFVS